MSRTWKWILGILGVLIVVGLAVGAVSMWRYRNYYMAERVFEPRAFDQPGSPDAPGTAPRYYGFRRHGMMDGWGGHGPMMSYGYRYSPHGFGAMGPGLMLGGGLFHLLLPLGILALVAYTFYQMGKRAGMTAGPGATRMPDVESLPRRKVARG